MPKIEPETIEMKTGTSYPPEFDRPCAGRVMKMLSDAGDLSQFGVHHVTLPPGCWASQRHYHSAEDEFVYILSGTCLLIDNEGETPLHAGDSCTHPAGDPNAHHLVNTSNAEMTYLVVGSRRNEIDHCSYPDIDLDLPANGTQFRTFRRKDGSNY